MRHVYWTLIVLAQLGCDDPRLVAVGAGQDAAVNVPDGSLATDAELVTKQRPRSAVMAVGVAAVCGPSEMKGRSLHYMIDRRLALVSASHAPANDPRLIATGLGPDATLAGDDGEGSDADAGVPITGATTICSSGNWCWSHPFPQGNWLYATWGTSDTNLWAVGAGGVILHWDGAAWSQFASNTTADLSAVWGSSGSDIWAAGVQGAIVHWNGSTWSPSSSVATDNITAVWGASSNDVWVAGWNGLMMHWNGATWSAVSIGSPVALQGLWGSSSTDVWAGSSGGVWHWNGASWTSWPGTSAEGAGSIRSQAPPPTTCWAVGQSLLHWNGSVWQTTPVGGACSCSSFLSVWATASSTDAWGVDDGGSAHHWNGTAWSAPIHDRREHAAARCVGDEGATSMWLVGQGGVVARWDGTACGPTRATTASRSRACCGARA